MQQEQNFRMGVTTTLSSYLIWGFLPLYWALLSFIPALDVLMYRISFAFLFMVILLIFARRKAQYINEIKKRLYPVQATYANDFCSHLY